jgi:hypothetical protein
LVLDPDGATPLVGVAVRIADRPVLMILRGGWDRGGTREHARDVPDHAHSGIYTV